MKTSAELLKVLADPKKSKNLLKIQNKIAEIDREISTLQRKIVKLQKDRDAELKKVDALINPAPVQTTQTSEQSGQENKTEQSNKQSK